MEDEDEGIVESFGLDVSKSSPDCIIGEGLLLDFCELFDFVVASDIAGLSLALRSLRVDDKRTGLLEEDDFGDTEQPL